MFPGSLHEGRKAERRSFDNGGEGTRGALITARGSTNITNVTFSLAWFMSRR